MGLLMVGQVREGCWELVSSRQKKKKSLFFEWGQADVLTWPVPHPPVLPGAMGERKMSSQG